jgi:hypothetical protein
VAPVVAAVAFVGAHAACAGACSTYCPAAGACSTTASAALGDGVGGFHLSEGAHPPSPSSSSSDDVDEFFGVAGGGSPFCSCSRYSLLSCSRRFRCRIVLFILRAARSCSCRCSPRAAARARGVGGSDRATSTVTLC